MSFLSGNEAIVQGALDSGAKFFSGYPITPASTIMEAWVKKAEENKDLVFLQAEDELAAVHQAVGAVLGGVPALTATSGPGLSLMQEGLGLGFVYQAPLVVVDVMRSGPSTGRATRVGQGEILASRFGTHGDVFPFVFYPSSVEECYSLTRLAFQVSWQEKVPVIILSDASLATLREKVSLESTRENKMVIKNGEVGHYSGLIDRKTNQARIRELKKVARDNYRPINLWGNSKAETLLVGLGSLGRALRIFEEDCQVYVPLRIWPFLGQELIEAAKDKKRILVVEMNEGQYGREVERVLKREVEKINYSEETIELSKLKEMING